MTIFSGAGVINGSPPIKVLYVATLVMKVLTPLVTVMITIVSMKLVYHLFLLTTVITVMFTTMLITLVYLLSPLITVMITVI